MPVLAFSLVAHEYAHGYAALKQGDDTALVQGRLTFNPIARISPAEVATNLAMGQRIPPLEDLFFGLATPFAAGPEWNIFQR